MLWNQETEQVKVQWMHFRPDEATWEMADQMRAMYPSLFVEAKQPDMVVWYLIMVVWYFLMVVWYLLMVVWYFLYDGLIYAI